MIIKNQNINQYMLYDTRIDNLFLFDYMPKAPANALRVYLLASMYAQAECSIDDDEIAKNLKLTADEVKACWDYWEDNGVLVRHYDENGGFDIELVNIKEQALGFAPAPKKETAPSVSLDDGRLAELYASIEQITGKLLDGREIEEIAVWMHDYSMLPEFIARGYKYSVENQKSTKPAYVGAILKDWRAKGLVTANDVAEYLSDMDKHYHLYKKVFRALGFNRNPSEEEKRRMNAWLDEMCFTEQRILEACAKTSGISNPNINYVDSVLKAWYADENDSAKNAEKKTESIMSTIAKMYEDDRRANAIRTQERRKEIYTRIPRIREIADEQKEAGYMISRLVFAKKAGGSEVEEYKRKISSLNEEKIRLLRSNGYEDDAADTVYTCKLCKDTGELEDGSRCTCFRSRFAMLQAGRDSK